MFKIITMCDSNYFGCGKLFLETRNVVKDHDIVCYHPDMTSKQLKTLDKHNIEHIKVGKQKWDTEMQFMKFGNCISEIDKNPTYKGFFLIDWDVFFVNDFRHLYDYDFDLCITVRPREVRKKVLRALGCGGGFFFKPNAKDLFAYAQKVIVAGGDKKMPEYDKIWRTLEKGRPKHKTHYRTAFRWWVDQVFISGIVLRYLNENNQNIKVGLNPIFSIFNKHRIAFVSERNYNAIKSNAVIREEKNVYVRHLQFHGRKQLVGAKRAQIKEKLDG
jgi:hypothetical protein